MWKLPGQARPAALRQQYRPPLCVSLSLESNEKMQKKRSLLL
jgi:hypothetical protein